MRWNGETDRQRMDRLMQWRTSFAWVPHQTVNGKWVWLEFVRRRAVPAGGYYDFQYVALGEPYPEDPKLPRPPAPLRK